MRRSKRRRRVVEALVMILVSFALMWVGKHWIEVTWRGPTWAKVVYGLGFGLFVIAIRHEARTEE